jgi:hypothetical protein
VPSTLVWKLVRPLDQKAGSRTKKLDGRPERTASGNTLEIWGIECRCDRIRRRRSRPRAGKPGAAERLSTIATRCPRRAGPGRWDPMNPAPPVTSVRMGSAESLTIVLPARGFSYRECYQRPRPRPRRMELARAPPSPNFARRHEHTQGYTESVSGPHVVLSGCRFASRPRYTTLRARRSASPIWPPHCSTRASKSRS